MKHLCTVLAITFIFSCTAKEEEGADLLLVNGNIWTGSKNAPDANWIAISNDRIIGVGSGDPNIFSRSFETALSLDRQAVQSILGQAMKKTGRNLN